MSNYEDLTKDELLALIKKSSLVETVATKAINQGGHPVIAKDGTMLVHKDHALREAQRAKDLQAHAATSRKLADALQRIEYLEGRQP